MSYYSEWKDLANSDKTDDKFWEKYFLAEKQNYEKILDNVDTVYEGTVEELSTLFSMERAWVAGFLDGINSSLKQETNLEELKEDTRVKLDIDLEKLYFNMHTAKADWLYNLPQWESVLTEEKRKEIKKSYKASIIAVSHKIGPNQPCPCGSGKKYKKCCGYGK
ncbi:MAG: SEC-C metal-binding domain-containing protein [Christensenellales bacterium]